jgi:hypothetical protein
VADTSITDVYLDPPPARVRFNRPRAGCCQHVQIDTIRLGEGMKRVLCLEDGCDHEWLSLPIQFPTVKP